MSQIPSKPEPVIEILHLDETGYGPNGSMTRREWRQECFSNLGKSKEDFLAWQHDCLSKIDKSLPLVSFQCHLTYLDGTGLNSVDVVLKSLPSYSLDYVACDFAESLHLEERRFISIVLFAGAVFRKDLNIWLASFEKEADFHRTVFQKNASFQKTVFNDKACFMDSSFNNADFNSTKIKIANFKYITAKGYIDFRDATFEKNADFHEICVNMAADFSRAIFKDKAWFKNNTFNHDAWFKSVVFNGDAIFEKAKFKNDSSFQKASFYKDSNFENAVLEKVGHFEEVSFKTAPPSFRGVDIATTRLEFSNDYFFPSDSNTQQAIDDISFLKRLSDEHGQADQALNFNAMELRAKRLLPESHWGFKTVTWLYEVVSDYGRSFGKPLGIYAALLFLTFLIALEHSADIVPRDTPERQMWFSRVAYENPSALNLSGVRAAAEYTLYRAAGVLDFSDSGKHTEEVAKRLFGQPIEPWWMRVWGVFKAIASTGLLFLAALGLRNKYRIK